MNILPQTEILCRKYAIRRRVGVRVWGAPLVLYGVLFTASTTIRQSFPCQLFAEATLLQKFILLFVQISIE